jgi:hypothetical protein
MFVIGTACVERGAKAQQLGLKLRLEIPERMLILDADSLMTGDSIIRLVPPWRHIRRLR